ncbi:ABC transporter permease [Archaeoglobales archaeon]|nr:MAG: ABC transporter permease [Archaeoglobales archaeon]
MVGRLNGGLSGLSGLGRLNGLNGLNGLKIRGCIFAIVVILVLWAVGASLSSSPALPSPLIVVISFISDLPELIPHMLVSAYRVIYSILLALSFAIPIGLISYKEKIDSIVSPFIYLLYPIPHIVLLPIIILLFGIGDASKIFLISMIVFFQILVTARDAARNVSDYYILSLKSLGASELDVYRHVIFPATLPKILTAMRISIGTAIAVLFFAESFATSSGLGYFILDSWSRADYNSLYSGIISMALLGFSLYLFVEFLEKKFCKWV